MIQPPPIRLFFHPAPLLLPPNGAILPPSLFRDQVPVAHSGWSSPAATGAGAATAQVTDDEACRLPVRRTATGRSSVSSLFFLSLSQFVMEGYNLQSPRLSAMAMTISSFSPCFSLSRRGEGASCSYVRIVFRGKSIKVGLNDLPAPTCRPERQGGSAGKSRRVGPPVCRCTWIF